MQAAYPAIDSRERSRTLDTLERERFDVVIIGGGITGAGLALNAVRRGWKVALLEAADFAAGTSGRSSKLIHGGLRYLAMGDVGLVRDTALERKAVHRIAPHLAEAAWMVVPVRSRASLLKFRAGLTTYEKLGAVARQDVHRNWTGDELAANEPLLARDRYPFACAYREYLTDDARLVLANLRSAIEGGAVVLNYATVESLCIDGGRACGVELVCGFTGRRVIVRAGCVVNAAGPWVEAVQRLEDPSSPSFLHLSKGIHIVVPRHKLPVRNLVILGTSDKRSIFAIPREDIVYLGTTDTSYPHGSDRWPEIHRVDVEYLLEPLTRYFDIAPLAPGDCVGAWAGLRPLIAEPGKAARELSRKDEIHIGPRGVVHIAGGKLTGYRKMAASAAESVARVLELPSRAPDADDPPLAGGDFDGDLSRLVAALMHEHGFDQPTAARLARLYGSESDAVVALAKAPLSGEDPIVVGEVDWAVTHEGAATLEDVVYRRTRIALYRPECCDRLLEPVARRMADLLDWSGDRVREEVSTVRERLAADLAFNENSDRDEESRNG